MGKRNSFIYGSAAGAARRTHAAAAFAAPGPRLAERLCGYSVLAGRLDLRRGGAGAGPRLVRPTTAPFGLAGRSIGLRRSVRPTTAPFGLAGRSIGLRRLVRPTTAPFGLAGRSIELR